MRCLPLWVTCLASLLCVSLLAYNCCCSFVLDWFVCFWIFCVELFVFVYLVWFGDGLFILRLDCLLLELCLGCFYGLCCLKLCLSFSGLCLLFLLIVCLLCEFCPCVLFVDFRGCYVFAFLFAYDWGLPGRLFADFGFGGDFALVWVLLRALCWGGWFSCDGFVLDGCCA